MNREPSNIVLFQKRKELQMTQQQVADKAGIQLRQYQRLEKGDRDIVNASGKIMLSICEALRLDPYFFLGKSEEKPEQKYIVPPPIEIEDNEYYIPCQAYYFLVCAIPRGMVCTGDAMLRSLRNAYGMQTLEIKPDLFSAVMYMNDCLPYWRIVAEDGCLINSIYCSKERQKEKLEAEGVKIIQDKEHNGLCVDEFRFCEYDLDNVHLTAQSLRNESE